MAQPGVSSNSNKHSSAPVVVVVAADDNNNNNPHYHELKNNDSLMVSFDRTFNDDDEKNMMKDVPYYRDFARDILATLKQHRSIQGCLEMILACFAIVTLYSTVLVYRLPWWWSVGGAISFVAVYFCVRTYLHTALCDALHQRIDEWKALIYARTNYALEWVPPEDWWNIYPGVQFTPKSSSTRNNKNGAETAIAPAPPVVVKYYVKMARFAPPRDLSARTIQDSTARPPALLLSSVSDIEADDDDDDDDDDESDDDESTAKAFFQFLGDAKTQLQLDQRAQLQRMVVVIIVTLIALWLATEDCDLVVRAFFITLVVFDLIDDCLVQHVLDRTDRTPRRLLGRLGGDDSGAGGGEEDNPISVIHHHRKSNEYEVTYHVDQPYWWKLRETYYTIARTPPAYRRPVVE
jgi:hypothetical protein